MSKLHSLLLLAGLALLLQGCSFLYSAPAPPESDAIIDVTQSEDDWGIADISGENQDGEPWSTEEMAGEWWVTKTIFTRCPTVCMTMTPNMAQLQEGILEEDLDVRIVSFTVDADFDTPERLRDYGESYGADFSNWDFVTGYTQEELEEFAMDTFRAPIVKVPEQNDIMHPTRFYLISPEGELVRMYSGEDGFDLEATIEDLKYLLEQ